ncbi:MAG: hypothetical protein KA783_08410 [Chitinophagales bacterium]|jgi:hypothetical protein|nr:hypothetical protein [Chitinophagales bacterium]
MVLSLDEYTHFIALLRHFYHYINKQTKVIPSMPTYDQFTNGEVDVNDSKKIQQEWVNNPTLLHNYVATNPDKLNNEDLAILESWKHFIYSDFWIVKNLAKHSLLLYSSPDKRNLVLAVVGLAIPFSYLTDTLPQRASLLLLPYKGKITFDGIFSTYNISFGGSIRKSIVQNFDEIKLHSGIIESLPITTKAKQDDTAYYEEALCTCLKSEENHEYYQDEIIEILQKNPELYPVYHREVGKRQVRKTNKHLRNLGLLSGWFALLDGSVIASGSTEIEAQAAAKRILPQDKWDYPYYHQLKKK